MGVSSIDKPVVFYGTSITQGGCASRPGMSFVNIVGRDLDVPVVNLGFSGSGLMELEMVRQAKLGRTNRMVRQVKRDSNLRNERSSH